MFQIYVPSCEIIKNDTYNTVKMLVDDETLNTLVLQQIEKPLQEKIVFRSIIRKKGVYIKLSDSTIIEKNKELSDIATTLYGATSSVSVNFYSINIQAFGLTYDVIH